MPTLTWIGKDAVVNHHKEVPFHLLRCDPKRSVLPSPPGSPTGVLREGDRGEVGNLLVQGDNLLALKALLPHYAGKVKCIYIDPPYNTGNENWVYNDAVNSPEMRAWLGKVVGGEAEDLSRHDKWLCMMYPRLSLMIQLLRPDGAIFVSIDDNEVVALRMLMDEIFGKMNFVTQFVWNTEGHTDNQFHIKINHEYIVMYAARETELNLGYVIDPNTRQESNLWAGIAENSITKNGPGNPPSEVELPIGFPVEPSSLNLPASAIPDRLVETMQSRGLSSNQLKAEYGKIQFPLRFDSMDAKNHQLTHACRVFSGWANVNKLRAFIAGNCEPMQDKDGLFVRFYLSENGVIYYRKDRGERARNVVSVLRNLSTTEKMRSELESMGLQFRYPKPKELIKYIVKIGSDEGDLILDSFAGSGTTAQAVLELNAERGNRHFILIELDSNIARDITSERVRRVVQGYKNIKGEVVEGLGGGFRYCELGETLFDAQGQIRREVTFEDLARHVYFTETGQPLDPTPRPPSLKGKGESPLLEVHNGVAVYLLYNGILKDKSVGGGNVLTRPVLASLPKHDGPKVIYGNGTLFSESKLRELNITFRQVPYEIKVN